MIQDGFIIMYVKDEKAHAVPMSNEQYDTLQMFISAILGPGTIKVIDEPTGEVVNLAKKTE